MSEKDKKQIIIAIIIAAIVAALAMSSLKGEEAKEFEKYLPVEGTVIDCHYYDGPGAKNSVSFVTAYEFEINEEKYIADCITRNGYKEIGTVEIIYYNPEAPILIKAEPPNESMDNAAIIAILVLGAMGAAYVGIPSVAKFIYRKRDYL
jgi:hypothetical protein